jgi:hypothetical protein
MSNAGLVLILTGCAVEQSGWPQLGSTESRETRGASGSNQAEHSTSTAASSPAVVARTASRSALPDLTPVPGRAINDRRQVLDDGPFTAQPPTVRANELHPSSVTGNDCMSCHGSSGNAPHFAFGGTIALGKEWASGSSKSSDGNYGSYGSYGSYGNYGNGGCSDSGNYGSSYGNYGSGSYGSSSYGNYGSSYGSYGNGDRSGYGTYGGAGCGTMGAPQYRTEPSPNTGVRVVDSGGRIFDTVTDVDGNFWYKTPTDVVMPAYTGIEYGSFRITGDANGMACASCHESRAANGPGRIWTWNGPTPK